MNNKKQIHFFFRKYKVFFLMFLFILLCTNRSLFSQKAFDIHRLSFCSSINDEFSPVFYKDGLVFCSNIFNNAAFSLESDEQKLFNIIYVRDKDSMNWGSPELFAKELTTILNEGPATFDKENNKIFYARNLLVEGKLKDINVSSNKQGIYSARQVNGIWSNIESFPYNSENYNLGTPSLSPDGKRLYFASDMPGGFGGTDIYFCEWIDGNWGRPVNLGAQVNTSFDESYPYADTEEHLFFSSNGHKGFGGKDIFYCIWHDNGWSKPIHLEGDINSASNDFGFITDPNFQYGFFSSDREGSLDLFSFNTRMQQFGICDTIKYVPQCFTFYDERFTDTLHLELEWDFGYGITKKGVEVQHCFSKPGNYQVMLTITHYIADSSYQKTALHEFEIEALNQPWFYSPDFVLEGDTLELTAAKSVFSDINDPEYYWNFGGGFTAEGVDVYNVFNQSGDYTVSLGAMGTPDGQGVNKRQCVQQDIHVVSDYQHFAQKIAETDPEIYKLFVPADDYPEFEIPKNEDVFRIVHFMLLKDNLKTEKQIKQSLDSLNQKYIRFSDNEMRGEDQKVLDAYAAILNNFPELRLEIAVHTNDKGSSKANQETSVFLAESIDRYLLGKRVSSSSFSRQGFGDSRPLTNIRGKNQKLVNQRIEFILYQR